MIYTKNIDIRWADLDPNFHVLHSKYYDFCAYARTAYLYEKGITPFVMQAQMIGPILLKEECTFKKEIKFGDRVEVNVSLTSSTENFSRWTMSHSIMLNNDILAATVIVHGAWMDLKTRKITAPPQNIADIFANAPKPEDYKLL